MEKNLDLLTRKIYEEGIGKANIEIEKLTDEARYKAESIVNKATKEAEKIIADAREEAETLKRNSLSEIRLGGLQAISSLKQTIQNLLSSKILNVSISETFQNSDFLKNLILEVVKEWKTKTGVNLSLPAALQQKLDKAFEQSLAKEIKNLEITYDNKLKGGFKISQKDDTYQIVFSDEDFVEFFKPYLKEKSRDILFS